MRIIGQVIMLICWAIMGLFGLALLFVFPPVGIVLLLIVFFGWSSWAARTMLEAKQQGRL